MQAVILAGGQGTRLKSVTTEIPKPMLTIGEKPLLEHHVALLKQYGITDIIILVNHLKEAIQDYFKMARPTVLTFVTSKKKNRLER